jgi:hypothetical protein
LPGRRGRVTERSFYPTLIRAIQAAGGRGVSEINFNSEPDIVFELLDRQWLLSVKIDETPAVLKGAFIQYQRHKDESRLVHGLVVFLPGSVRRTPADEASLEQAVDEAHITCLIDTPDLKEEYRRITFQQALRRIVDEVGPKLEQRVQQSYPLKLVVAMLQQHVRDMMTTIQLSDPAMLRIITDPALLSGIGHLRRDQCAAPQMLPLIVRRSLA